MTRYKRFVNNIYGHIAPDVVSEFLGLASNTYLLVGMFQLEGSNTWNPCPGEVQVPVKPPGL
jgi:hypothetical protein